MLSTALALERVADRLGVKVTKALDPLDPDDFVLIIARLALALRKAAQGAEEAALRAALEELDVDWPELTAVETVGVLAAAKAAIAGAASGGGALSKVLQESAQAMIERTRSAAVYRYGLTILKEPTRSDQALARSLRRSQMVYVKDEFGRRADVVDRRAKEIVADGLERGLGRVDISEELSTGLSEYQVARSRAYWNLVASDFANKSRTLSHINSFDEAGIEEYRFSAVGDERTCPICMMLDGTTWSVSTVKDQLAAALDLEDPEDIREARPWIRLSGSELYIMQHGERRVVSHDGERIISEEDMLAAGITVPPVHGECRCTIETV
jgi:SPP1 gp7 family putative phage head morphogenesis protein